MANSKSLEINRTGIDMSPVMSKEMIDEANKTLPSSEGDELQMRLIRNDAIADALSVGTVPVPGTLRGMARTGFQKFMGRKPEVLIDKLGERLAFERSSVRLYDGLINKCDVQEPKHAQNLLPLLKKFREEKAQHFDLLCDAMKIIGADPTAVTPSADIIDVAGSGIHAVIYDPRTSMVQSIHALLLAEMMNDEGWTVLIKLTDEMGQSQMAESFRFSFSEEKIHLENVRRIYEEMVLSETRAA